MGNRVTIPFKFSSVDLGKMTTTAGTKAATVTSSVTGTTESITYAKLRVIGVELDGSGSVDAVPLLGRVGVTNVETDGGKPLTYKTQWTDIVPGADGLNGNLAMYIPSLRQHPVLLRTQTAEIQVKLSGYCTASKIISTHFVARLICEVMEA